MSRQVFDYLVSARKEAERHLFDIDRRIRDLEQALAVAKEERTAFVYLVADFTHKLRSIPRTDRDPELRIDINYAVNALSDPEKNSKAYVQMRNALAHGIATEDRKPTIKEMIVTVLSIFPDGLDVGEILDHVRVVFGTEVPRTSLSPQLSRMKTEEEVDLLGDKWRLRRTTENSFEVKRMVY